MCVCMHANTAVRVIFYIFLILVKYIFFLVSSFLFHAEQGGIA